MLKSVIIISFYFCFLFFFIRRDSERRYDDRRHDKKDRDRYDRNDRHKDAEHHRRRNDSPRESKDSDHSTTTPATSSTTATDTKVSNTTNALRKAEALNRTIERRANEKVQQLQKLGIEIPALMQQQQQFLQNQQQNAGAQIKPLMSINLTAINSTAQASASNPTVDGIIDDNNLALNMANFTSPILANARYTEQMQKKKLIWGAKKVANDGETTTTTTNNKWEAAKFSQDNDGKVASKFLRLMGMKNVPAAATNTNTESSDEIDPSVKKREQMFSKMEQQYEIARQVTHTMRGMGLGFGSQSRPC